MLIKTGHQIEDVGGALSWNALDAFINYVDLDSALGRELSPEFAEFASDLKRNWLLADIFDMLANINANIVRLGGGKAAKPQYQPRPLKDTKKQKWDTMSAEDFDAWLANH